MMPSSPAQQEPDALPAPASSDGRRWRLVVLSTHFDDAVLSLGGRLAENRIPKAVVTVHGGAPAPGTPVSGWDADCGFRTAEEAHRVRKEEDRLACALVGADQVTLPNPDNPYRTAGPLQGLHDLLGSLDPHADVAVPLSTSQPDHRAVRDAALDALAGRALLVYADLPYAPALTSDWLSAETVELEKELEHHDPAFRELAERYDLTPVRSDPMSARTWSRKRQAILSYASQLSLVGAMGEVQHMGPLLRFPGALQRELIWRAVPKGTAPAADAS
ncbi:PIG-L deacetylase family protein [Streptomyces mesophilus]|uniref:PIG-L deacetylase family protein n=1 Tax=Streptomyces mesophilus TaxID=1775132 RepID=UPI00331C84E1